MEKELTNYFSEGMRLLWELKIPNMSYKVVSSLRIPKTSYLELDLIADMRYYQPILCY